MSRDQDCFRKDYKLSQGTRYDLKKAREEVRELEEWHGWIGKINPSQTLSQEVSLVFWHRSSEVAQSRR